MNIHSPQVTYSSIVEIGENTLRLEQEKGRPFLKLHRGVMDVTTIDLNGLDFFKKDLNSRDIQQYSGNDGLPSLIETINKTLGFDDHRTLIVPGGMSALDLVINSLSDTDFHVPYFHWGSWSKILAIHGKKTIPYDEFNLDSLRPRSGVIMCCFPSNPTGYQPSEVEINDLLKYAEKNGITVLLDLPYYHLFHEFDASIKKWMTDNVVFISSFSKSVGLSGFRIGYVVTRSKELYQAMRIRSLYKYNSISVIPQMIIRELLEKHCSDPKDSAISKYRNLTIEHIENNVKFLADSNLLMDRYPKLPLGPFAVTKLTARELLENYISSVPMSKFNLEGKFEELSRISVAVQHDTFKKYFAFVQK